MSLKRNFTLMLGSKVSLMAAGLITGALVNRSLGPSGRGVYAELQTWVALFVMLFGVSMDTAIYHFSNKTIYGNDDSLRFVTTFALSFAYAIIAAMAFSLFVAYMPQKVSSKTSELIWTLDILLITTMLAANLTVFYQALGNMKFSALIGVVQAVANLVVIGYGYLYKHIDINFVVTNMIIIQSVALSMLFWESLNLKLLGGRFSISLAKEITIAGIKQHIATISTFIYMKINQLIVFKYCGESEAGIYAVSLNLAFYLMFIPATFQTVLYPRVIHSNDDFEVTIKSLRLGFYFWGALVIILMLLAKPIILIYGGSSFLPSVTTFRILMIAAWFLPLSALVSPYYIKAGAFGMASFSAILLGIISIGLNLLLVPQHASMGAALATAITTFTGFCIVLIFLWYLSKKNPLIIFNPSFDIYRNIFGINEVRMK